MLLAMTQATLLHRPASDADGFLPEGPRCVIVDGRDALAWVNIQTAEDARSGTIWLRFWDNGEVRSLPQPKRPGFLLPTDRPNTLLVGIEKSVGLLDVRTNDFTPLADIPDDNPRTIINDGETTLDGSAVVFGTKDVKFEDAIGHLYLFTIADRTVTVLADGQTCSNGKFFRRDGSHLILFDIDTPTKCVRRYRLDLEARTLSEPTEMLDLRNRSDYPDGMCDAGDGSAIIAFYNPAKVATGVAERFDLATGKVLETWEVPGSPRVTCPLLRERDGKVELVLTTAIEGMPDGQKAMLPDAGSLFVAATTIGSLPPTGIVSVPSEPEA